MADRYPSDPAVAKARDALRVLLGLDPPPPEVRPVPDPVDGWTRAVADLAAHRYAAAAAELAAGSAEPERFDWRFVRGDALSAAGDAAAGDRLMAGADLVPLADVARRSWLADRLAEAGLPAAVVAGQRGLAARLADPFHQWGATADLCQARRIAATAAGDDATAVDAATRLWVLNFWPGLGWTDPAAYAPAYLTVPAELHLARAGLARHHDDWPAVAAELAAYRTLLPFAADGPLIWVLALDAHGDHAAADAMFDAVYDHLDAQSLLFPRSPFLHNQAAWLAACCCRRLDAAAAHAEAAVQLAPADWQLQDTLAECRFRGGDRSAAVGHRAAGRRPARGRRRLPRPPAGPVRPRRRPVHHPTDDRPGLTD